MGRLRDVRALANWPTLLRLLRPRFNSRRGPQRLLKVGAGYSVGQRGHKYVRTIYVNHERHTPISSSHGRCPTAAAQAVCRPGQDFSGYDKPSHFRCTGQPERKILKPTSGESAATPRLWNSESRPAATPWNSALPVAACNSTLLSLDLQQPATAPCLAHPFFT